ncbi:hypothetical protein O181_029485 [Austropuccinia psidii MF-1]|uniref:Uncharacterized protein n=1 Tax=Austropuccinia psidii MF-1 TaxID=1389203 RepID=A0A9Q3CVA7_9BASI|nr:hypothetical protein [Austropuccinia psidii MF-1]
MNPPQPPDSNVSFDEMFHRVLSNNTYLNSLLSYRNDTPSHSSTNSLSTPNQSTQPHECYNLFDYLNSPNIVPPAPITHPQILPCPPPNNMNRTPFQLGKFFLPHEDVPKHPPNVTPRRSSQHELPHLKNDQSLEVPANSIPTSPAQIHPLTPKNEILQEELHVSIVENNSSPNVPSQIPLNTTTQINAMTPHVVLSPMQINHVQSSHTLSAPHFENPNTIF